MLAALVLSQPRGKPAWSHTELTKANQKPAESLLPSSSGGSVKRKWSCSVLSDSLWPHGLLVHPPGSSVHGILQARILEWVAISFSRASSQPRDQTRVSRITGRRFTAWTTREAAYSVRQSAYKCRRRGFHRWVGKIPLEEEVATTHSSTPACRIPSREEAGGLQSMGASESRTQLSD